MKTGDAARDDLGHDVTLARPMGRVVSLVPSLTEAIASTCLDVLVGATDWCTHPADLDIQRVRGTKNPDRAAIETLEPDLVIANQEENRELDVRRLREAGVQVWVTRIETLDEAFTSMRRLFTEAIGRDVPAWLLDAEQSWSAPPSGSGTVAVPIWRDPWMVVGPRTFTTDLLRRLGWHNIFDVTEAAQDQAAQDQAVQGRAAAQGDAARYPHVDVSDIDHADVDLVLLPDEPYVFTAQDGPEAFGTAPTQLVSGRLLTWYGPSLAHARNALPTPGS